MLAGEYDTKPFGSHGELIVARPVPRPAPSQPFVIPPPNWAAEERERRQRDAGQPEPPQQPQVPAVERMMAAALERDEIDEPPPLGPAVHSQPLTRPVFPEPDWNTEEAAALERNKREQREHARRLLDEQDGAA
jgi:hypothetical protein